MAGNADTLSLRNRAICNITYQNLSLETREDIEKLLYRASAKPEVLDEYHTWKLRREVNVPVVTPEPPPLDQVTFGPSDSVDLAKSRGYSGSVQYYHDFTLDTSAWPSPDLQTLDTRLWQVPYYLLDVELMLPLNWRELGEKKTKKQSGGGGGACFNCGSHGHSLGGCPKPKDQERIRKALSEWRRSRMEEEPEVRYHDASVQEQQQQNAPGSSTPGPTTSGATNMNTTTPTQSSSHRTPGHPTPGRVKPKPGVISERLRQALGIDPGAMPPWYRNIVFYGYPPSYYRVLPKPVKFTWVGADDVESTPSKLTSSFSSTSTPTSASMSTSAPQQPSEPRRRIRTVNFPNLAAPLHDLSYFFDLYHPVEDERDENSDDRNSDPTTPRAATKYNVTTTVDGQPTTLPSYTHTYVMTERRDAADGSNMDIVDLTSDDENQDSPAATTTPNPKKRPRDVAFSDTQSHSLRPSQTDEKSLLQEYGYADEDGAASSGSGRKRSKAGENEVEGMDEDGRNREGEVERGPEQSASERADALLDQLVAMRVISRSSDGRSNEIGDDGDKQEEEEETLVPQEDVTARLPVGNGVITHSLTEQDLSTHGPVQTSSGVWNKLRSIIEDRKAGKSAQNTPAKNEHGD